MKRILSIIDLVTFVVALSCTCMGKTDVPPDLKRSMIFCASFNGSAEATLAKGKRAPVTLRNVTFEKTAHGQGMYVGKEASCVYETAGNLNNAEGTLSMWLIPKGWIGGDSYYTYFFESGKDEKNKSVVYKQSNYNGYFMATVDGKTDYSCGIGVGDWLDREPLHLVCTWGAFGRATYTDGELTGRCSNPVSDFGSTFTIGCSATQPGYVIVDEVHIFDRALTGDEVVELFKATEPENWKQETPRSS